MEGNSKPKYTKGPKGSKKISAPSGTSLASVKAEKERLDNPEMFGEAKGASKNIITGGRLGAIKKLPNYTEKGNEHVQASSVYKTRTGQTRNSAVAEAEKALNPHIFEEKEKETETKITGETTKEDLIMELVKMKSLAIEREECIKNMTKQHKVVEKDVREYMTNLYQEIAILKDKDANVKKLCEFQLLLVEKDEEIEELKAKDKKITSDFDKVSKELDEANKLIGKYTECSLRDINATPEDLEDYQEELQGCLDERDEEISRLEDYEEAIDKLRDQFGLTRRPARDTAEWIANTIWEKDSELDELRDDNETTMESHTNLEVKLRVANRTMAKFRESIEMLKKEKGMMEKDMEEMKVAFSVVSTKLEMDKEEITRIENMEKENKELKEDYTRLGKAFKALEREEMEGKFNLWRELQMEMNPQYSMDDEVEFLLRGHTKSHRLAKEIFDDLYAGEYVLDIKKKEYQAIESEDESE